MLVSIFYILVSSVVFPYCGNTMQKLWTNQLGDIYSVGLGSAACLGAAFACCNNIPIYIGAVIACILNLVITTVSNMLLPTKKFIVFGLIWGSLVGAIGVIFANNANPEQLQQYYHWTSVSFQNIDAVCPLITIVIAFPAVLLMMCNPSDLTKYVIVNLLVTSVISMVGIIGMISLVIPNVVRFWNIRSKYYMLVCIIVTFLLLSVTWVTTILTKDVYLPISATMSILMCPLLITLYKNSIVLDN